MAEEHGCRCHGCGSDYRVDVLLPDDLWKRIILPPEELLCGRCIFGRVEGLGEFAAFEINSPGERSSRQAWAEEALRLQETATADPWGCDECMDADPEKPLCDACYRPFTFCSCVSDEQAAALVEAGFARPQCTVHPNTGGAR